MLADVLKRSGELQLAARHLILAGLADAAHDLGREATQYLDVTRYLDEPAYWAKASALRLIAADADLVPDDQVAAITEKAFTVLDQVRAGELRDTPFFAPSASLAAHEALAALSERLTASQAARLLDILEPLTSVDRPDQYRHTDRSHAIACTGIGRACPQLAERAIDQLLGLLERASHAVPAEGRDLIAEHLGYSCPELERQRDGGGPASRSSGNPLPHRPRPRQPRGRHYTAKGGRRTRTPTVHSATRRHTTGPSRNAPPARKFAASGAFSQRVAGDGFEPS